MDPLLTQMRRIAGNRLWDAGLWAVAIVCLVRLALALPERAHRIDLAHYYTSSRLLIETGHPYGTDLTQLYQRYGFIVPEDIRQATNPPSLLWLFVPFVLLTPGQAFVAWAAVQALALGAILWQTKRLLRDRLSPRAWRFLFLGILISHPIYWHFLMSQSQLLSAALVLTAYAWQREGKHWRAILAVMVTGFLKIFPLILLPWFIWRSDTHWRGRLNRALVATAVGLALVGLTGWRLWVDFYREGVPVLSFWALHSWNFTLPSFVIELTSISTGSAAVGWLWAGLISGLGVITAAYAACWRGKQDAEVEFSLLCVAMLLGSLVTWGHYLVFLFFPVAVWVARLTAQPTSGKLFYCALTLVLLSIGAHRHPFLFAHPYLRVLVNWSPMYGLFAMGVALARELNAPAPAVSASSAVADGRSDKRLDF